MKSQPRDSNGRFADQGRHIMVSIRLTPAEYADLRYCSEHRDISMTEFIAKLATANAARDRQQEYMLKIRGVIQNRCGDFVN